MTYGRIYANTVTQTVEHFGRLDLLVNHAQEFHTGIAVKETSGTVINMGSGVGTQSISLHGAYRSNKEAIRGLRCR